MLLESTSTQNIPKIVAESGQMAMVFSGSVVPSPEFPAFIPADQAYYWSIPWQESERRALADLAAGRSRTFADPADAVRYLLSGDQQ
jgi:hypothetical protein